MTPADPVPSLNGPTRFDLYHGERICKHFDGAGWCFGTIDSREDVADERDPSRTVAWMHATYDDGDEEEYEEHELPPLLEEAMKRAKDDPVAKKKTSKTTTGKGTKRKPGAADVAIARSTTPTSKKDGGNATKRGRPIAHAAASARETSAKRARKKPGAYADASDFESRVRVRVGRRGRAADAEEATAVAPFALAGGRRVLEEHAE